MVAGDAFQKSTENEKGAEDDTLAQERNDHGRFDLDQHPQPTLWTFAIVMNI